MIIIISKTILLTISYYYFTFITINFITLNLSIFSNSDQNCGRFLFVNRITLVGLGSSKPNDKIIKSITSNLNIVLELSKNDADV